MGTNFANKSECAAAAYNESLCETGEIMWNDAYNSNWGCRCCKASSTYADHATWDLCTYGVITGLLYKFLVLVALYHHSVLNISMSAPNNVSDVL